MSSEVLSESSNEAKSQERRVYKVMELTTCQKLMDTAVTQLLEQCHSLKYLDLGPAGCASGFDLFNYLLLSFNLYFILTRIVLSRFWVDLEMKPIC